RSCAEQCFQDVLAWVARQPGGGPRSAQRPASDSVRVREPNIVGDPLSEELRKLATRINDLSAKFDEELKIEFSAIADRCLVLAQGVVSWLAQDLEGQVYWVETPSQPSPAAGGGQGGGTGQRLALVSAPIDVGPALREALYQRVPSVILTSATLSIGGRHGFSFFQDRLGLQGCQTLQLGSPFNYR